MNTHAYDRVHIDYNIFGVPTVYFDGGYQFELGASSSAQAEEEYRASIDTCIIRPMPNLEVELLAAWNEGAVIYIQALIRNNDSSVYQGHLRVYVSEIQSTRGWNDTRGKPYLYTFLDYALDEDITVNPQDVWVKLVLWDGNEHFNGYGYDFGDITQENTALMAAVFNPEPHLKYNLPPWGRPFNAYYLDAVATGQWANLPPLIPADPLPADLAKNVELDAQLSWTGGDPNPEDTVSYDISFGSVTPPPLVSSRQSTTDFDPGELLYFTTYYWQVIALDNSVDSTTGPVWTFTTKPDWLYGDCNRDQKVNISDGIYLINYLFKQGPEPDPLQAGDANCDAKVTISDVIYLVNYLFKGGLPPAC